MLMDLKTPWMKLLGNNRTLTNDGLDMVSVNIRVQAEAFNFELVIKRVDDVNIAWLNCITILP